MPSFSMGFFFVDRSAEKRAIIKDLTAKGVIPGSHRMAFLVRKKMNRRTRKKKP